MQQVLPPRRYTLVESKNLECIQEQISSRFREIWLRPRRRDAQVTRFGHAPLPDSALSVGFFQCDGPTDLISYDELTFVPIIVPLSGSAGIDSGGEKFVADCGRAIIPGQCDQFEMSTSANWCQAVVRLDVKAVESRLAALIGGDLDESLVFERQFDLGNKPGRAFAHFTRGMIHDLGSDESLIANGVTTADTERMIINSLLYTQHHNYSDQLEKIPGRCTSPALRKARNYLNDHKAESVTIADLVNATGVSGRSLYRGFREQFNTTPMAYLKKVRLETAHRDLQQADAEDSVTEIAMRAGFSHLGRFSAEYRLRFGVTPSETLKH